MNGLDLKIERVRRGLKQYRVAAALDIPQSRLSQWENGKQPMTPEQERSAFEALHRLVQTPRTDAEPDRVRA